MVLHKEWPCRSSLSSDRASNVNAPAVGGRHNTGDPPVMSDDWDRSDPRRPGIRCCPTGIVHQRSVGTVSQLSALIHLEWDGKTLGRGISAEWLSGQGKWGLSQPPKTEQGNFHEWFLETWLNFKSSPYDPYGLTKFCESYPYPFPHQLQGWREPETLLRAGSLQPASVFRHPSCLGVSADLNVVLSHLPGSIMSSDSSNTLLSHGKNKALVWKV